MGAAWRGADAPRISTHSFHPPLWLKGESSGSSPTAGASISNDSTLLSLLEEVRGDVDAAPGCLRLAGPHPGGASLCGKAALAPPGTPGSCPAATAIPGGGAPNGMAAPAAAHDAQGEEGGTRGGTPA